MDNILISIDQEQDAQALLDVAQRIADRATLMSVVRVVYEGIADLKIGSVEASKSLRKVILESEMAKFEEWIAGAKNKPQTTTVWNRHRWQGVLDVATAQGSDLILVGLDAGEKELFRTPDDWRLLRHSYVPIFFFRQLWSNSPRILVALDIFDIHHAELNHRILKEAAELVGRLQGRLDVMAVYPSTRIWVESGLQSEEMLSKFKEDICSEASKLVAEACRSAGIEAHRLTIAEGNVAEQLARESQRADVLVLGTKACRGTATWTVGNACEKILHRVQSNVLVVP